MIMEIERLWGQDPGWYAGLTRTAQIDLMAWYRVQIDPAGQARKAKKAKGRSFWTG